MHYIYCYTNKFNQHKYVGQTNNLQRRIREHSWCLKNESSTSYNALLHKKMRQYGEENFNIEVLETIYSNDLEEVNKREQYWIQQLQTFRGTGLGYNSDFGGGKKPSSMFTLEEIQKIKDEIKSGVSYLDLQQKYSISASFLSSLNHGVYFYNENEIYPLYQYYKTDKEYDELIELLVNSNLSLSEIAKQLQIGYSTVKKINSGKLRKGLYPTYPIRKQSPIEIKANQVKNLLLNSSLTKREIANIVEVSDETIRRINLGLTHFDDKVNYPLRNL